MNRRLHADPGRSSLQSPPKRQLETHPGGLATFSFALVEELNKTNDPGVSRERYWDDASAINTKGRKEGKTEGRKELKIIFKQRFIVFLN